MKKIAVIVSFPGTVEVPLRDPIEALSRIYQVSVVLNLPPGHRLSNVSPAVEVVSAPIERNISPLRDLRGLIFLVRLFTRHRFDAIHSVTPKAGLLTALAGVLTRVPIRIHTFTGQAWATRAGFARRLLKTADSVIARLATHVLADSPSQREFLVREGVLPEDRCSVLANGSISGVDELRFHPDPEARARIRKIHGIPDSSVLFLYLGRLKFDKGILDLAHAFSRLVTKCDQAWMLIVGPDEEHLTKRIEVACAGAMDKLRLVDQTDAPESYMAASDVFCLPTYREGFPSSILQAASVGIPSIASDVYGVTDAVEAAGTGLLHPPGDVDSILQLLETMVDNPQLRNDLGRRGRDRVHRLFTSGIVISAWRDFYRSVVG